MSANKSHLIGQTILWCCFILAAGIASAGGKEFFIFVLVLFTGAMSFFTWYYTAKQNADARDRTPVKKDN